MNEETKKLRHDRHTVSLLTDLLVFSPKYRGKMLVGDVAMIAEGIICKTCKELDIEIIENAVNPKISSKVFPEFHCEEIKRKNKQDFEERISSSQGMVRGIFLGSELFSWIGWEWMGCSQ